MLVAGNGDSIFKRLMDAIGRPRPGRSAPDLVNNTGRVAIMEEMTRLLNWSAPGAPVATSVLDALGAAARARERVYRQGHLPKTRATEPRHAADAKRRAMAATMEVPGIVPQLSGTPGTIRSSAPHLGDDTDAVLAKWGSMPSRLRCCAAKVGAMNAPSTVWQGAGRHPCWEVGLRDGPADGGAFVPTADKDRACNALSAASLSKDPR